MEMLFLLLTVLVVVGAQPTPLPPVDPTLLELVFGKPEKQAPILIDEDREHCQCVPYFYCFENITLNNAALTNPTMSGYGMLNIRFKVAENCQESTERCCKVNKINTEVEPFKPDATRLKGCGYRNVNGLDFTITGGEGNEAQFGEFPWVVAILDAKNKQYHGVGVLIHPQVVMTGASIVHKFAPGEVMIRAGEWDTQTDKERLPSQERIVREIRIRKDFGPGSLINNIALLRLKEPVELTDHINVACLPDQDEEFQSQRGCIANGWGKDKFGSKGRHAVILKKVELSMVPHFTCNQRLKNTRLGRFFKLHESFVCAVGEGNDTCQGDGGAPLVCPVGDNRYKLSGLVAWGIGCGQRDLPSVYAKVSLYRDWVDDVMTSWNFETSGYEM